jgi:hypothetical protein
MAVTITKHDAIKLVELELGNKLPSSRVHFANINVAKAVWWLEIPLTKIAPGGDGAIHLLLANAGAEQLHYLRVPTEWLRSHQSDFDVRRDKDCLSLELSSNGTDRFHDVRSGSRNTDFSPFLVRTFAVPAVDLTECEVEEVLSPLGVSDSADAEEIKESANTDGSTVADSTADHSLLSSYREMLLEHLFAGEVMRYMWFTTLKRIEVLKPQVDDGGYDLVMETDTVVRHIQLKSTFKGSTVNRFNVNTALANKPSGCVVCIVFDDKTLSLGPFYWFGDSPNCRLPDLSSFKTAKHTKGDAQGVKKLRPKVRVVPLTKFEKLDSVAQVAIRLFGKGALGVSG